MEWVLLQINKIKDFLSSKNAAKDEDASKNANEFRKLPKIPLAKITVNIHSSNEMKNDKLPDLASPLKKLAPAKSVAKKVLNSNTPASPATSRKITLETMLFGDNPKEVNPSHIEFKNHDITKVSSKRNGVIKSYAANTNQGILRDYNEDRVSIILNVAKPESKKSNSLWPKISFFGVFDGHGGASWADFLRDNLHSFIVKDQSFPQFPKIAIKNGFKEAE